jgi:glycosyltransferase involved in cell wall biosynthesis
MKRTGGIIVSRLTPAYFTEQAVLALKEAGYDPVFCTTLSVDGADAAARLLRLLGWTQKRRLQFVDAKHLHTCPWREAARLALGQLTRDEIISDRAFHWMRDGYDAWLARQMRPPTKMVYAAETECLETFKRAKEQGIRTVLDLPSPEHDYVENLLYREYEKFPELLTKGRRHLRTLQAERTARRHEEFRLADRVVANSQLTARTWAAAGLDGSKIRVVTYGSPQFDRSGVGGGSRGEGPLRLVWAGTFSVRKGAHYLLEAWHKWNPGKNAVLEVYGSVRLPATLLGGLPENIVFRGPSPQRVVFDAFSHADLLVFPTLADGFGLVVTEAFSRALPVLTTRQAGASDLIEDRVNGLLVAAGSAEELVGALSWSAEHRADLRAMREAALSSAERNQWHRYRADLADTLKEVEANP